MQIGDRRRRAWCRLVYSSSPVWCKLVIRGEGRGVDWCTHVFRRIVHSCSGALWCALTSTNACQSIPFLPVSCGTTIDVPGAPATHHQLFLLVHLSNHSGCLPKPEAPRNVAFVDVGHATLSVSPRDSLRSSTPPVSRTSVAVTLIAPSSSTSSRNSPPSIRLIFCPTPRLFSVLLPAARAQESAFRQC